MPIKDPEKRKEYERQRYQDPKRREKKNGYDVKYRTKPETKEYQAQWYLENKERQDKKSMEYYFANKEKLLIERWAASILKKFGLTVEQYYEMEKAQNYRCAICKTDKPGKRAKRWHIDHDHKTKEVRKLLCHGCNLGIGHFRENIEVMQEAIEYLRK